MPKLDIEQCLGCGSFVPFVLETTGLYVALCWWCGCTMTQVHGVRQPGKLRAVPTAPPTRADGHHTPTQPSPSAARIACGLGGQPAVTAAPTGPHSAPTATTLPAHA